MCIVVLKHFVLFLCVLCFLVATTFVIQRVFRPFNSLNHIGTLK